MQGSCLPNISSLLLVCCCCDLRESFPKGLCVSFLEVDRRFRHGVSWLIEACLGLANLYRGAVDAMEKKLLSTFTKRCMPRPKGREINDVSALISYLLTEDCHSILN